jgi:hypothetical protein
MANTTHNTVYTSVFDPLATIGRRSHMYNCFTNRMIRNQREPYPANFLIQQNTRTRANRFESIGHLSKADILWTASIVADTQLDRRSKHVASRRDTFLEDLVEIGLYDRVQGERRDSSEEVSMRYTSVCTSAVMEHVEKLESKVSV